MVEGAPWQPVEQPYGAVNPPVVRSSTFTYPDAATGAARFAGEPGLLYSRLDNPTVRALEEHLAGLEGAEDAVCTASGMGAIHITLMSLLRPGARLVTDDCVYGCSHSLMRKLRDWGVDVTFIDSTDLDAVEAAVADGADVVFVETPMNPTTRLADIPAIAGLAHAAGATLVVDNTFATPVVQQPLRLGADLVVHSLTKAIGGHSDLIGGVVVGPKTLLDPVREWRKDAGPVMDPETAWLALRGARTLDVRIRQMNGSALAIAGRLEAAGHQVRHPLLASHPDHRLAKRQTPGGGHVFTLDLGTRDAALAFIDGLQVFQRAVSLGGFESLVSHPASTTHACIPEDARERAGITAGLVRFSVGLEPIEELQADIERALPVAVTT